jgi:hypothetical protein
MKSLGPFWLIIAGLAIFLVFLSITELESLGLLQGILTVTFAGIALLALFETLDLGGKDDERDEETWEDKHKRLRRNNARNRREKGLWN